MRRIQISLVVVIGLALSLASAAYAQENVLVIVADNVSPELIEAYGEGSDPAPTPTLDALAASGVLFKNAASNPFGGPTRATLLTGRYGFRTNVGARKPPTQAPAWTKLDAEEVTIPEMLEAAGAGYRSAALGEWNIGPLPQGFEYYAGAPDDLDWNYLNFTKRRHFPDGTWDDVRVTCDENNTDPVVANHSAGLSKPCYETTNIVDEAILKIGEFETAGAPWLVWVAFHAARSPFHMPPADLLPSQVNAKPKDTYDSDLDSDKLRAMVEAMDTEIGRLLSQVPADTTVVFVSDNAGEEDWCSGTPALRSCIRVPLIVRRPGSSAGEVSDALVNTTDLFATVAEIAGVTAQAEDSVSLVPYLATPAAPTQHRPSAGGPYAYAEYFHFGVGAFGRAISDAHYKYVWDYSGASGPSEALYDLAADPGELTNLLLDCSGPECVPTQPPAGPERAAYRTLSAALFKALHDPDWDDLAYQKDNCLAVQQTTETCDSDGDGIGSACDCDFNNDGICDASDESILTAQLDLPAPSDFDPDMNCDATVDTSDHDLFLAMCDTDNDGICDGDQTPGLSGLYCADPLQDPGSCWAAPVIPDSGVTVRENILLIVLDDTRRTWIDPDLLADDPTNPNRALTPIIDGLGRRAVVFDRAYGSSLSTHTRATVLTGLYPFRSRAEYERPARDNFDEPTLAQLLLPEYRTAAFGKLGAIVEHEGDEFTRGGFEYYAGSGRLLQPSYYDWTRLVTDSSGTSFSESIACASVSCTDPSWPGYENCYATSVTVTDTIAQITDFESAGDPWLIWFGSNAPGAPDHVPPYALLSEATRARIDSLNPSSCGSADDDPTKTITKAMLEAVDTEIDRLLQSVPSYTTIIIVGGRNENTPGFLYGYITEFKNRSPLIIKRPGMAERSPARHTQAFVNTSDVFATVMALARIDHDALDSETLVPYLVEDPQDATQVRTTTAGVHTGVTEGPYPYVYFEKGNWHAGQPLPRDVRAIRGARFKYITDREGGEQLYDIDLYGQSIDLLVDFGEPNLYPDAANALADLRAAAKNIRDADADRMDYMVDDCVEVWNPGLCDTDGDTVGDFCSCDYSAGGIENIGDDCQCDIDVDSIGNFCDCDFDNNGICDEDDKAILLQNEGSVGFHPTDMNCDGGVDLADREQFLAMCDTDSDGACDDGVEPGPTTFPACDHDGVCEGEMNWEDCLTCPTDCISGGGCGDGVCDASAAEDCASCPADCNGKLTGPPGKQFCCGDPSGSGTVPCSDGRCTESGFSCSDSPVPIYCCGDEVCEGLEDSLSCEVDCPVF